MSSLLKRLKYLTNGTQWNFNELDNFLRRNEAQKKSQRWQRQRQHRARNEIKLPFCDVWYSFRAVCKHTNVDIGNTQNEIEESKKTPSIGIDNIDISTSFSITMQQRNIHLMRCATIRSFFSALRHSFHHSIRSIQVETRGSESERERETLSMLVLVAFAIFVRFRFDFFSSQFRCCRFLIWRWHDDDIRNVYFSHIEWIKLIAKRTKCIFGLLPVRTQIETENIQSFVEWRQKNRQTNGDRDNNECKKRMLKRRMNGMQFYHFDFDSSAVKRTQMIFDIRDANFPFSFILILLFSYKLATDLSSFSHNHFGKA